MRDADDILRAVKALKAIPDPLNGATELVAAPGLLEQAKRVVVAARPGSLGFAGITIREAPLMPEGVIIGTKPNHLGLPEVVLWIGPGPSESPPAPLPRTEWSRG